MNISEGLLERLACPVCRAPLAAAGERLRCVACGRSFEVTGGMPMLLPESAQEDTRYPSSPATAGTAGLRGRLAGWPRLYRTLAWSRKTLWRLVQALTPSKESDPAVHVPRLVDEARRMLPAGGGPVLDVGGGYGPYKDLLQLLGAPYEILEVDPANPYLRDAPDSPVIIGDVHRMPLQDRTYAVVSLFQVLEHLYDPVRAMEECGRVLKPGGLCLITVPMYQHVHGWPSDYYRYTPYGLAYILKRGGMEVISMRPMGGPMMVVYHALEGRFGLYVNPLRRLFLGNPLALVCGGMDRLFSPRPDKLPLPDTYGWAVLARKRS